MIEIGLVHVARVSHKGEQCEVTRDERNKGDVLEYRAVKELFERSKWLCERIRCGRENRSCMHRFRESERS